MSAPTIRVERLAPSRRDDFLAFFDHERGQAFADNPEWARCYCHYYQVPKSMPWKDFTAQQNRVAMAARIDAGEAEGFLAYAGDEVVGWLNAQPCAKLPHCSPGWASSRCRCRCRRTRPRRSSASSSRRRGAAGASPARCSTARWRRSTRAASRVVDAFPFRTEGSDDASDHYHGPASLFEAAGFVPIAATEEVLRRPPDRRAGGLTGSTPRCEATARARCCRTSSR